MPTVLFGLDGADPELVQRWEDDLPGFQRLIEEGWFGELESIQPPITVPAWMCMLSGRPPQEFHACDFKTIDFEDYDVELVDSSHFRGRTLLDDEERTISFRVPGTTPGYEINGPMVTGFIKGEEMEFLPADLEDEMGEDLDLELDELAGTKAEKRQTASNNFQTNIRAYRWLLKNRDFDRAYSVFRLIDTWMHNCDDEAAMKQAYLQADEALQELIQLCEEEGWDLLVTSDHGSGETQRKLYLNGWLDEQGYLQYSEDTKTHPLLNTIADIGLRLGFKPLLRKAAGLVRNTTGTNLRPNKQQTLDSIDWDETAAFSYLSAVSNYGAIWIHDDRFSEGIVDDPEQVRDDIITELRDHDHVVAVHTNEQLFDDPSLPDLLVETTEDTVVGPEPYSHQYHHTPAVVHNRTGLVGGIGPGIRAGTTADADLVQVAPTIEALDGPVTTGTPVKEALQDPVQDEAVDDLDW